MKIYHIENDIEVFGEDVTSFPKGIDEAFNRLIEVGKKDSRTYYGIGYCVDNKMTYAAATSELYIGEANEYDEYDVYTIEAGDYLCEPLYDWRSKTNCIKDIFAQMLEDERAHKSKPSIEIYLNDDEMLCLIKMKTDENVIDLINNKAKQITDAFKTADNDDINSAPFTGSWTPAQVMNHLTKSNLSIAKAMSFEGSEAHRGADKRVPELRQMFLDYSVKYKSSEFIKPEEGLYDKQLCINAFKHAIETLNESAAAANVTDAISHPAFGEITKLELLHFTVFHLQRHLRQLNIMLLALQEA